jgi:GT2 family glycosyltransferase
MSTIGVGIITCNRPDYLKSLLETIPIDKIDKLIIVNDGKPCPEVSLNVPSGGKYFWLDNPQNVGVAKSKNSAIKYLYDRKCDYIFIIEDDMLIKDENIFDMYIQASLKSGIQHFNYGPGSPFNRKQQIKDFDLHNRHLLDQHSEPNPRLIVDYGEGVKVALYEHTVAMFSFFTRKVIEEVGYIDEDFPNCWEHVSHTYNIIKAGMHPPFWWFADIAESEKYLTEAPGAIDNSAIAKDKTAWIENVRKGAEIYKNKHGHYPNQPPYTSKEQVIQSLKTIKEK